MINDVVLEGIIVRTWKFADDLLFRLACYRDPDLPNKSLNDTPDAADFYHQSDVQGKPGCANDGRGSRQGSLSLSSV